MCGNEYNKKDYFHNSAYLDNRSHQIKSKYQSVPDVLMLIVSMLPLDDNVLIGSIVTYLYHSFISL